MKTPRPGWRTHSAFCDVCLIPTHSRTGQPAWRPYSGASAKPGKLLHIPEAVSAEPLGRRELMAHANAHGSIRCKWLQPGQLRSPFRISPVDRLIFPHFSGSGMRRSSEPTARSRRSRRRSVALGVGITELAAITPMSYGCFYATFRTAAQAQNQLGRRNPQLEENNASRLRLFEV